MVGRTGSPSTLTQDGSNETHYRCDKMKCACIPGRFLCGEDGSVSKSSTVAANISLTPTRHR